MKTGFFRQRRSLRAAPFLCQGPSSAFMPPVSGGGYGQGRPGDEEGLVFRARRISAAAHRRMYPAQKIIYVLTEFQSSGIGASRPQNHRPPAHPSSILKQQDRGIKGRIHTFGSRKSRLALALSFVPVNCPARNMPVPSSMMASPTPTA